MTQTTEVKILEEGTPLMVALGDPSIPKLPRKEPWPDVARQHVPPGTTRFEKIIIGPPKVDPSRLGLPGPSEPKAEPLFIGPPQR